MSTTHSRRQGRLLHRVWVNKDRLVLVVITNTSSREAEFRVEGQHTQNTKVPVQISPWNVRWADKEETCKLKPGTFGVVRIGHLEKVGKLAQVLRLLTPDGELMLEPSGIVGTRGRRSPVDDLKMLGIGLRVFCDGAPETFELLVEFSGLEDVGLKVIDWPSTP